MSTQGLERAISVAAGVISNVKSDQLEQPTPCASWTVRDLLNHIIGGQHWFATCASTGKSPEGNEAPDLTQGDMNVAFAEASKSTIAAFNAPGTLDKTIDLPFGQFPGVAFLGLATTDTFQHAWDLAKATGQDTDLDPELAAQLLEGAKASIPDQFRGPDGSGLPFGPVVEVPDTAPPADQLAGFLGRQV